ncbi:MAG: hypothetical protein ACO4AJ_09225, partial [Prochlorothrix sp.]
MGEESGEDLGEESMVVMATGFKVHQGFAHQHFRRPRKSRGLAWAALASNRIDRGAHTSINSDFHLST